MARIRDKHLQRTWRSSFRNRTASRQLWEERRLGIIAKSGLPVFAKNNAKTRDLSRPFVGLPTQTCLGIDGPPTGNITRRFEAKPF